MQAKRAKYSRKCTVQANSKQKPEPDRKARQAKEPQVPVQQFFLNSMRTIYSGMLLLSSSL